MTFERKYKDAFSAKPTAKVMIATNELPCFTDRSQGVWRRLLLAPFNRSIPEYQQNKNLAEELKQELSKKYPCDIEQYQTGKSKLIQEIIQKARKWRETA